MALCVAFPANCVNLNTGTTIALGALAFIILGAFTKSQALQRLIFYPRNLKDIHWEGITPVMTLGVAAQNASDQSAVLKSIAGEIYANDYLIGNISYFTPQIIYPNAETIIFLNARLFPLAIVSDIIDAINNKTFDQTLEIESQANIDNLQTPLDLKFKFGK